MITLQYLEYSPQLASLDEGAVVDRLGCAYEHLPFSHLIIGWDLPTRLLESCRVEAGRLGVRFLRWQPVLTGDRVFVTLPGWQVIGATGQTVAGFMDLPEFTFACPNHPGIREQLAQRLEKIIQEGIYDGLFLDRVRYPSPAGDPVGDTGCFCEHCRQNAANMGLDLENIRRVMVEHALKADECMSIVQALMTGGKSESGEPHSSWLTPLLHFRQKSISDLVGAIAGQLRAAQLEVGLDCFSPCLAPMVGQDLSALSQHADWIKLMTYAHALGPAGLPFELLRTLDYLSKTTSLAPAELLQMLGGYIGLPLPTSREALAQSGLSPAALAEEVRRGVQACSVPVLAGVELVELDGVTRLHPRQIKADLKSIKLARPAGLSVSWDLLHIPLDRLSLVNQEYLA